MVVEMQSWSIPEKAMALSESGTDDTILVILDTSSHRHMRFGPDANAGLIV